MEREAKENLIKILREGSQRQFRKVKKEDLIELFDEIWKDENESRTSFLSEIEDLRSTVENQKALIESHENTDKIIEEYQALTQEIRGKYEEALEEAHSDRLTSERLFRTCKTLRISLIITVAIEILTIILAIVL